MPLIKINSGITLDVPGSKPVIKNINESDAAILLTVEDYGTTLYHLFVKDSSGNFHQHEMIRNDEKIAMQQFELIKNSNKTLDSTLLKLTSKSKYEGKITKEQIYYYLKDEMNISEFTKKFTDSYKAKLELYKDLIIDESDSQITMHSINN